MQSKSIYCPIQGLLTNIRDLCHSNNNHCFDENFSSIVKEKRTKDLTLVLLGEISSGKTSLINKLVSYNPKNNSFYSEFSNILPTHQQGNTGFLWTIHRNDEEDCFKLHDSEKEEVFIDVIDLKKRIFELNKIQIQEVNKLKNGEINNLKEIKLYVPDMIANLTIMDFPGVSCKAFVETFKEKIKYELVVFILVKSLDSAQQIDENTTNIIKDLTIQFKGEKSGFLPDSNVKEEDYMKIFKYFFIVFTKKDKIMEVTRENIADNQFEEEDEDSKLVQRLIDEKLKRALELSKKNIDFCMEKNFNVKNVYAFNLLDIFSKRNIESYQKETKIFRRFYKDLQEVQVLFNETVKNYFILNNLKEILDGFMKDSMVDSEKNAYENLLFLDLKTNELLKEIKIEVSDFFEILSNYERFKIEKFPLFTDFQRMVQKEIKNETFSYNRNNCLKQILQKSSANIQTSLQKSLQMVMKTNFYRFFKDLMQNYNSYFAKVCNLKLDFPPIERVDFNMELIGFLGSIFGYGTLMCFLGTILTHSISILGMVTLTVSALSGAWSLGDYIGLWRIENCAEDAMKSLCAMINENKEKFVEEIDGKLKEIFKEVKMKFKVDEDLKLVKNIQLRTMIQQHYKEIEELRLGLLMENGNGLQRDWKYWERVLLEDYRIEERMEFLNEGKESHKKIKLF